MNTSSCQLKWLCVWVQGDGHVLKLFGSAGQEIWLEHNRHHWNAAIKEMLYLDVDPQLCYYGSEAALPQCFRSSAALVSFYTLLSRCVGHAASGAALFIYLPSLFCHIHLLSWLVMCLNLGWLWDRFIRAEAFIQGLFKRDGVYLCINGHQYEKMLHVIMLVG